MTTSVTGWTGLDLRPGTHVLHGADRRYRETNCYIDVLIELLHGRGLEPLAVLGTTVAGDFEGDQWTFCKPAPEDLRDLVGVDVHEYQPYRRRAEQIEEQLRQDRTLLFEADAFHLPDTAGTSYGAQHVKTSIAVAGISRERRLLSYIHNYGRHVLADDDYDAVFASTTSPLPLYTELVRFRAADALAGEALRDAARERLRGHLDRRPADGGFRRLGEWLDDHADERREGGADEQIFATVRMAGASAELAAAHTAWAVGPAADAVVRRLDEVSEGCRTLAFKLARGRPFSAADAVVPLHERWESGLEDLARLG